MEDRSRALDAAEKSYLKTAHTLGYQDAEAQQWVSAVMSRLRLEESGYKLRMLASAPTSPSWSDRHLLRRLPLLPRHSCAKRTTNVGG